MRLREFRAGGRPYRWILEARSPSGWEVHSTMGLLFWNYFARRSESVYQNDHLTARDLVEPDPFKPVLVLPDRNTYFGWPAWYAPMVGMLVVALEAAWLAGRLGREITPAWVAGGALLGALIGCLVALCDGPGPGTVVSRFLALISPVMAVFPLFGLPFNLAAVVANGRHSGWPRTLSRITLVVSLLVSLLSLVFL